MSSGASITITKLTDRSPEVIQAMKAQALIGLKAIGEECEGFAKEWVPVDTGRLRNSIDHRVDKSEMAVYIGTNVEYAPYVEFIDRYRHNIGEAHFLRNAAQDHLDYYREILEACFESVG